MNIKVKGLFIRVNDNAAQGQYMYTCNLGMHNVIYTPAHEQK